MRELHFITVGLGPVGRALTLTLKQEGHKPLILVGRGRPIERQFARRVQAKFAIRLPQDIDNIDFVLTTLPSSALSKYATVLATERRQWDKLTFIHASGSYGIEPFESLKRLGAGVAAMHPYQTFPKTQRLVRLRGITYGITGNRKGLSMARQVVKALGGRPIMIREADRLLYHLSAILACTFVAADIDMAVRVLKALGVNERRALETALPIAEETIRNIRELGIRAAMTGPQTRGDEALIRRHLKALRERLPELVKPYSTTSRFIMDQGKKSVKKTV